MFEPQDTVSRSPDRATSLTSRHSVALQTERMQYETISPRTNVRIGGSTEPGAPSVTMSWAIAGGADWGIVAVPLRPHVSQLPIRYAS